MFFNTSRLDLLGIGLDSKGEVEGRQLPLVLSAYSKLLNYWLGSPLHDFVLERNGVLTHVCSI